MSQVLSGRILLGEGGFDTGGEVTVEPREYAAPAVFDTLSDRFTGNHLGEELVGESGS